ncbi:hypothetical protein SLE2022_159820 [Rubroshorea leprosula]
MHPTLSFSLSFPFSLSCFSRTVKQDTLSTVSKTKATISAMTIIETKPVIGTVMMVKKRDCKRSQLEMSENFRSKNWLELQRLDTTIHGQMVIVGTESPRKSMDHLRK